MSDNPFDELSDLDTSEAKEEEKKERKRRENAKYYVVKEAVEFSTAHQVTEYLRDNFVAGMTIVKGFQSVPKRRESYEF